MSSLRQRGRAPVAKKHAPSSSSSSSSLLLLALALLSLAASSAAALQHQPRSVEVYGFSPANNADSPIDPEHSYDWSVLTTLAWRSDPLAVRAAHSHGARVDLDARQGAASIVLNGTVADAAQWIAGVVSDLLQKNLDGVNFDLEVPIVDDPDVARRYTALVAGTSAAVKAATFGRARVTVDVPFLPYDTDGRDYDYEGLAKVADALFVMAYDMQALIWGRCAAAANAPLPLVERSVRAWLGLGVPREKLILGLPWYGYSYACLDDDGEEDGDGDRSGKGGGDDDGRDVCRIAPVPYAGAPCSDAGGAQVEYQRIMALLDPSSPKNVTPVRFDPLSTSLYFNYRDDPPGSQPLKQIWFDDPTTLLPKMRVAARQGLGGVGFWNVDLLAYDDRDGKAESTPREREQTKAMWDAVAQAVGEWEWKEEEEEDGGDAAVVRRRRARVAAV